MKPDFHDGHLEGLFVSGSSAKVFLKTVAGERFTLVLKGVERLRAQNFHEGNIVFSVDFIQPGQLSPELIDWTYGHDGDKQDSVMDNRVRSIFERVKQMGLKALEISASYGCSAAAVFKDYELMEGYVF